MSTQQTYEQRVQALAEEMAIAHYLKHPEERAMKYFAVSFSELPVVEKVKLIHIKRQDARIAVKRMTEAVRDGVWAANNGLMSTAQQDELEKYLKEQGLIPDQGAGRHD